MLEAQPAHAVALLHRAKVLVALKQKEASPMLLNLSCLDRHCTTA